MPLKRLFVVNEETNIIQNVVVVEQATLDAGEFVPAKGFKFVESATQHEIGEDITAEPVYAHTADNETVEARMTEDALTEE